MIPIWIRQFFAAPVFEDDDKTRAGGLINIILLILLAATIGGTALTIPLEPDEVVANLAFGFILTLAILGLRNLVKRGHIVLVGAMLSLVLWGSFTFLIYNGDGIRDSSLTGYFMLIILAALLTGAEGAIAFGLLSILSMAGFALAEMSGLITFTLEPISLLDVLTLGVSLGLVALLLRTVIRTNRTSLEHIRRNERAQIEANRELRAIRDSLEERVTERTHQLEQRSQQLQTAAEVGRAAISTRNMDELLVRSAQLIAQRFEVYHAGIFLLDENGRYALLRAASSTAGQDLLAENYKLEVNNNSLVGYVATTKEARVINYDDQKNWQPDLPNTRSQAALPLVVGQRLLGALDVHSQREGDFDQQDTETLQILADQLAVAIENARLFAQSQQAVETARRAYGEASRLAWAQVIRARPDLRYQRDTTGEIHLGTDQPRPELVKAAQTGQIVHEDHATLALPVQVRDQVIGAVRLRKPDQAGDWSDEEIALMQALTEQLGVALDSAQLHQDTRRRAAREQLVREITGRVRASTDVDTILQTALRELGQALHASGGNIQLETGYDQAGKQEGQTVRQ